ncbi:MAG TPA: response regulator transcription factor [Gemmatimonas sp.]|uniref:response regulator transcription factor n=1 Tax=Gemmatimonas sp. TaxID=1962908 RepID=UPI002EDAFDA3
MTAATLLVVEDNADLAFGLEQALSGAGHRVLIVHDGDAALERVHDVPIDLIILDLMLPHRDGFATLRALRGREWRGPVLVLTARSAESDKVQAFSLGADDYVTKPFALSELQARVTALLRRSEQSVREVWRFGDVLVDPSTHEVLRNGEIVMLTPKEYELLVALLRHRGAVVSRANLLREVWSYHVDTHTRTVDIHMAELRRKLEPAPSAPRYLLTVRKAGYRLARG